MVVSIKQPDLKEATDLVRPTYLPCCKITLPAGLCTQYGHNETDIDIPSVYDENDDLLNSIKKKLVIEKMDFIMYRRSSCCWSVQILKVVQLYS